LNGKGMEELAMDLVAVVPKRHRNRRTMRLALSGNAWLRDIAGPLTLPVLLQYVQVRELVDAVQLNDDEDSVSWRWSHSGGHSPLAHLTLLCSLVRPV
jgi:hypothetical protein